MSATESSQTGIVQKPCQRCGKAFSCGASAHACDCFSVNLSSEVRRQLKENYNDCLCVSCLEELNRSNQ
ncbi:hypothetical protein EHQ76_00475 [Leptospira barantonii]|uniref:Cysteine-rich CWC family protein n=1 Tax=Leptospira barantonii TaxID=2023184 RepID=A0A5F2BUT8_9LEPT|nr:cysteine-rich CWC family protein [Leptospira barantonii]TGM10161.1 hypothetical protein EHQ76_00475 [Leptospira barantonii]